MMDWVTAASVALDTTFSLMATAVLVSFRAGLQHVHNTKYELQCNIITNVFNNTFDLKFEF